MWQGVAGTCWLLVSPNTEIEGGAFYLDCEPTEKHLKPEFTHTEESVVDDMIFNLDKAISEDATPEPSS